MRLTIVDSMVEHAQVRPDEIAFRFIADIAQTAQELSYAQLLQGASSIAEFLRNTVEPGSRIMLFFPPGLAYIKTFYGCLLAGMVAVPLYPPRRNVKSDRIIKVAQSCQSTMALTTESELAVVKGSWDEQNTVDFPLTFYATDRISSAGNHDTHRQEIDPAAPAFLQYTSGSTGTPKGVIITHQNIIANMRHLALMSTAHKDDVFVNWLPLFHDLGLVTAVLLPVYLGAPSVLMAPATFIRDPVVWLKTIDRYGGSLCGAPNFAFELCVKKIAESELSNIDISTWRVAYNAAEPVSSDTITRFSKRFSVCGFKEETFYPSYGMAEATVLVTGGEASAKPLHLTVDKRLLAEQKLELVDESHPLATKIVACGAALPPHDVRIVDPQTCRELANGVVGEIWFSGPSVSPGYWQLDEITAATFEQIIVGCNENTNRYLRTGDLGVVFGGELFVTGRIKDLIILNGRNYYPQDIELSTAEAHAAIRGGYIAAFSRVDDNVEQLVIVAEIEREYLRTMNADEVISAIRQCVFRDHEVNADQIVLIKPYKIPVTSSGKIQRKQTKKMLLAEELDVITKSGGLKPDNYVAPTSEMEHLLCDIWCKVLGLNRISITDHFLDVGGNSLAAMEISAEVRNHFKAIDLEYAKLLELPTIEQSAEWLELKIAHMNSKKTSPENSPRKTIKI
jgi:acyl-CoA synthetase (AMP-forming)/AMP-acid ligase II